MSREDIIRLLEAIIMEVDYDTYKELFVQEEDPDTVETLIEIVEIYLGDTSNE